MITRKRFVYAVLLLMASCALASAQPGRTTATRSPILDEPEESVYAFGFTIVEESHLEGFGDVTIIGVDSRWAFAHFYDVLYGDLDFGLEFDLNIFADSGGVELPDQVTSLSFKAGGTWRYVNDVALLVRVSPGIFSDIEELSTESISVPFFVGVVKTFDPRLAGMAGLEIRSDFENIVVPHIGLVWDPTDYLRVDARFPKGRIRYDVLRNWQAYAALEWESTTYALREKGSFDRDDFTWREFMLFGGVRYLVSHELHLATEIGQAFDRQVEFGESAGPIPNQIDVGRGFFVRFALLGPF